MSTKSRLLALTDDLKLPELGRSAPAQTQGIEGSLSAGSSIPQGTQFPPVVPGVAAARTGPGQMLQFRGQMLAVEGEVTKLREELKQHDGSLPTRKLDPKSIVASKWANRHEGSFAAPAFASLKADIESAGGNVQAILVRPLAIGQFEIVFGHRRHRACLELGIEVLAAIYFGPLSDLELFGMMERENRERADLSPYEQGAMYRRALDEQLFTSQRRLAEGLGVSHTWIAKTLAVADLPGAIVECFRSPVEITHRHAEKIASSLETDRKGLLRRAEKLRQAPRMQAASVVAGLVGHMGQSDQSRLPRPILVAGKTAGRWTITKQGGVAITLDPGIVPEGRIEETMASLIEVLLKS